MKDVTLKIRPDSTHYFCLIYTTGGIIKIAVRPSDVDKTNRLLTLCRAFKRRWWSRWGECNFQWADDSGNFWIVRGSSIAGWHFYPAENEDDMRRRSLEAMEKLARISEAEAEKHDEGEGWKS